MGKEVWVRRFGLAGIFVLFPTINSNVNNGDGNRVGENRCTQTKWKHFIDVRTNGAARWRYWHDGAIQRKFPGAGDPMSR